MMTKIMQCPKCKYKVGSKDIHSKEGECPSCGVIYEKYFAYLQRQQASNVKSYAVTKKAAINDNKAIRTKALGEFIKCSFLHLPEQTDSLSYWSRMIGFALFALWGLKFMLQGIDSHALMGSFMHNVNLPFHEAGHIFFIPFGRFMTILGGSLFQVLLPFGLMLGFVFYQKEIFGAAIMLWWTGQSLIDISPYIDDAIQRNLPLIGGMGESAHDWGNLLRMTDMLQHTHTIANICFVFGCLLILASYAWGFYYFSRMRYKIR